MGMKNIRIGWAGEFEKGIILDILEDGGCLQMTAAGIRILYNGPVFLWSFRHFLEKLT